MGAPDTFAAANCLTLHTIQTPDGEATVVRQGNAFGHVVAFALGAGTTRKWYARAAIASVDYEPAKLHTQQHARRQPVVKAQHGDAWTTWAHADEGTSNYLEAQQPQNQAIGRGELEQLKQYAETAKRAKN